MCSLYEGRLSFALSHLHVLLLPCGLLQFELVLERSDAVCRVGVVTVVDVFIVQSVLCVVSSSCCFLFQVPSSVWKLLHEVIAKRGSGSVTESSAPLPTSRKRQGVLRYWFIDYPHSKRLSRSGARGMPEPPLLSAQHLCGAERGGGETVSREKYNYSVVQLILRLSKGARELLWFLFGIPTSIASYIAFNYTFKSCLRQVRPHQTTTTQNRKSLNERLLQGGTHNITSKILTSVTLQHGTRFLFGLLDLKSSCSLKVTREYNVVTHSH